MPACLVEPAHGVPNFNDRLIRWGSAYGLAFVGALMLLTATVGAAGTMWLYESESAVGNYHRLVASLKTIIALETDAETGQRGFVITGREEYLEPYTFALEAMPAELENASALVRADSDQMRRLVVLRQLIDLKQAELARVIDARRADGLWAAQKLVSDNEGKRLMDQARETVDAMSRVAASNLVAHRRYAELVRNVSVFAGLVSAALTIALLVLVGKSQRRISRIRALAADELAKQKDLLETMLASIDDGVLATDGDCRIRFLNATGQTLTQRTEKEAIGRTLKFLMNLRDADSGAMVENPVAIALREKRAAQTPDGTVLITRDGSKRFVSAYAAPITSRDGHVRQVVLAFRDVTAQRTEKEEHKLRDGRRTQFIATLSHELRNPLASMRNAVEVLSRLPSNPPDAKRPIAVVERQIRHMQRMLDDLLLVARLTSEAPALQHTDIDLRDVVEDAAESAQTALDARHQQLETSGMDKAVYVHGDQVRLAQALSGLLLNASQHSPDHSTVGVFLQHDGKDALIRVTDEGEGLAEADLEKIFEWFVQLARPAGELNEGLGVGLPLARQIAELHGGTLHAASAGVGKGSTFELRLRQCDACGIDSTKTGHDLSRAHPGLRSDIPSVTEQPGPILVADDNRDAADGLASVLRMSGFVVETAYDGISAYDASQTLQPPVLLLDIGMPGMNGYELARAVRNTTWGKRAKLVAITGWGQDEDRQQAAAAGFDLHFTKPVDFEAIERVIHGG